ncbi:unnamed protein product [Rhizoctonia solani]|uniref:CHAT domain-containing protein n=1 Tax=Rhizoctonia solani TaxID=456999 RepID=A0A8H3DYK6_9AGAM|nr:unnamed protein product [Rhizoctonia solani]
MPPDADEYHNQAYQAYTNSFSAQSSKDRVTHLLEAHRKFQLACKHSRDVQSLLSRLLWICHTYCELAQTNGKTSARYYAQRAVLSAQRARALSTIAPTDDLQTKAGIHHALGAALLYRYICLADDSDLDIAISELSTSVDILPADAPDSSKSSYKTHHALAIYLSSRRSGLLDPTSLQQCRGALVLCDSILKTSPIFLTLVTSGLIALLMAKEFVLITAYSQAPSTQISNTHMEFGSAKYIEQIDVCMGLWQTTAAYGSQFGMKLPAITGQFGSLTSRLLRISSSKDAENFKACAHEISDLLEHSLPAFHLHQTLILIDMLSMLVWQREHHQLYLPGLIEKIERYLDKILPETHFMRAELNYRMGKWSQVEQKELGRTMPNYYLNHTPAIQRFRRALELTPDFHPQQLHYVLGLGLALVDELTLPTTFAKPSYRASVIDELKNIPGILELSPGAPSPIGVGAIDALTQFIEAFDILSDRDPSKNFKAEDIMALFESARFISDIHSQSQHSVGAGTLASLANFRSRVVANGPHNMGLSEVQSRQLVEETVREWQEIDSRRSDPGFIDVDVDIGLGEALLRQGQLIISYGGDLQEARRLFSRGIEYMERSVCSKIASTPAEVGNIVTLGEGYMCRHLTGTPNSTSDPTSNDLELAVATFRSAGVAADSLGLPHASYQFIFNSWAAIADEFMLPSALEAYSRVIDTHSQAAWMGFDVQMRYENRRRLSALSDSAAKAACYACMVGNPIQAIEFLEKTKSMLHTQNLTLGLSFDHIRTINSPLANDLERISKAIKEYSFPQTHEVPLVTSQTSAEEQHHNTQRLRALGQEWDQAVTKIREIEGYQNFLKVPSINELCAASSRGPIALIFTGKGRGLCYGIVIKGPTTQDVCLVQLPLTAQKAEELASQFDITVSDHVRGIKEESIRGNVIQRHLAPLDEFNPPEGSAHALLTELWRLVMRPIIDCVETGTGPDINGETHLWISVTGPLSSLPLHAAGEYEGASTIKSESVLDRVICSYAPNLSILIRDPPTNDKMTNMFTLSGGAGLNAITTEIEIIHGILGEHVTMTSLDRRASTDEVKQGLRDAHIAHFACHGLQDLNDPLKSRLSFSGDSDIEVGELMSDPLPNARLAVLLACETAQGDVLVCPLK